MDTHVLALQLMAAQGGIGVGIAGLRDAWAARRLGRVRSAGNAATLQIR